MCWFVFRKGRILMEANVTLLTALQISNDLTSWIFRLLRYYKNMQSLKHK